MEIFIAGLIISTLAGIFSAIAFIPQTVKSIVTKSTAGLSIFLIIIGIIASIIWILWGVINSVYASELVQANGSENPLGPVVSAAQTAAPIWTNSIVLIFTFILLVLKLKNIFKAKKLNLTEDEYSKKRVLEIYKKYKNSKTFYSRYIVKMTKSFIHEKKDL